MQRLDRNVGSLLNSQQQRIARAASQLTRQTLTHQHASVLRRRHTCDPIEPPEPLIDTINLYATCSSFTRLVDHHALDRNQRTRTSDPICDKLAALFQIGGELFAEEIWR